MSLLSFDFAMRASPGPGGGGLLLFVRAMKERLKKVVLEAVEGLPGSVRVPGWGGEGGGVEARKSTRAEEEAGLR